VIATLSNTYFFASGQSLFMPRGASSIAEQVDILLSFAVISVGLFCALFAALLVFLVLRYRQRTIVQTPSPQSLSIRIQLLWVAVPSIFVLASFLWGFVSWMDISIPPGNAMEIRVHAQRWSWNFSYPSHELHAEEELVVPHSTNIKLLTRSADVIHSLSVPEFRIKRDVLPHRDSVTWFNVPDVGQDRRSVFQTVAAEQRRLGAIIWQMGFAANRQHAEQLIANRHVRLNRSVATNPARILELYDMIEIELDQKLKQTILKLEKDYSVKIAEAEAGKRFRERKQLQKELDDQFEKLAPAWLREVLAALQEANTQAKRLPSWLFADRDGLRGLWGFISESFDVISTEYSGTKFAAMTTKIRVVSPELFAAWLKQRQTKEITGAALLKRYGCIRCHSTDGSEEIGPSFKGLYNSVRSLYIPKTGETRQIRLSDKTYRTYIRESILQPNRCLAIWATSGMQSLTC
jgi:cytochrome c oxidase subunit 2